MPVPGRTPRGPGPSDRTARGTTSRATLILSLAVALLAALLLLAGAVLITQPFPPGSGSAPDPADQQAQAAAVDEIEAGLGQQAATPEPTTPAAGSAPAAAPRPAVRQLAPGVWTLARVRRLGLVAPVNPDTDETSLATGLGHWRNGVKPGARGNYVLAGHRVTHTEPFADFTALRPGDPVVVETSQAVYTYVLDTPGDGLRVDQHALWVTHPRPEGSVGTHVITLITCAETFHTDDRLVAFGHLDHVTWKTRAR